MTVHHLIITMCEKSFRLPCLGAALFHSALTHFVLDHIGCIRVELLYSTFIKQPSLRLWITQESVGYRNSFTQSHGTDRLYLNVFALSAVVAVPLQSHLTAIIWSYYTVPLQSHV